MAIIHSRILHRRSRLLLLLRLGGSKLGLTSWLFVVIGEKVEGVEDVVLGIIFMNSELNYALFDYEMCQLFTSHKFAMTLHIKLKKLSKSFLVSTPSGLVLVSSTRYGVVTWWSVIIFHIQFH